MKAQELRIGNYIYGQYSFDDESKKELCEVLALDSMGGLMEYKIWVGGESGKREFYYEFEPIPLTEERLIDFGFKSREYWGYSRLSLTVNSFTIEFEIDKDVCDCYLEMIGVKIIYVHELQNLFFALTGKELELKNKSGSENN